MLRKSYKPFHVTDKQRVYLYVKKIQLPKWMQNKYSMTTVGREQTSDDVDTKFGGACDLSPPRNFGTAWSIELIYLN